MVAKPFTCRFSDGVYEAAKQYAHADDQSMNTWLEQLIAAEDMRRRCAAHEAWMSAHPQAVAFHRQWADANLDQLTR